MLASVDGAVGPAEEARIPVNDEGLLRGDGAFEAMRLYGGRPFALDDHLARLQRSCAGLRLEPDFEALRGEITGLLEAGRPGGGRFGGRDDAWWPKDRLCRAVAPPRRGRPPDDAALCPEPGARRAQ